jgi:hypothetical protein
MNFLDVHLQNCLKYFMYRMIPCLNMWGVYMQNNVVILQSDVVVRMRVSGFISYGISYVNDCDSILYLSSFNSICPAIFIRELYK